MPREVTIRLGEDWRRGIKALDVAAFSEATLQIANRLYFTGVGANSWNAHRFEQGLRFRQVLHALYREAVSRDQLEVYSRALHSGLNRARFAVSEGIDREDLLHLHYNYLLPDHLLRSDLQSIDEYAFLGRRINDALVGKDEWRPQQWKKTVAALDHLTSPTARETVLLRGFRAETAVAPGQIIQHLGYLSATASRPAARSFSKPTTTKANGYLVELTIPAGTPYISVWMGSTKMREGYLGTEQEILLGRDLKIRFNKHINTFKDGVQVWQAEILSP